MLFWGIFVPSYKDLYFFTLIPTNLYVSGSLDYGFSNWNFQFVESVLICCSIQHGRGSGRYIGQTPNKPGVMTTFFLIARGIFTWNIFSALRALGGGAVNLHFGKLALVKSWMLAVYETHNSFTFNIYYI